MSEGGFAKNKVSSASLLDASVAKDKSGKTYYKYCSGLMQHCCHRPLYLHCITAQRQLLCHDIIAILMACKLIACITAGMSCSRAQLMVMRVDVTSF